MRLLQICILLCVIILNTKGQQRTQVDSLVLLEYNVYNSTSIEVINMLLMEKYFVLKNNGQLKDALNSINRINEEILNDSAKYTYLYEYALIAYLNNMNAEADLALQKLFYFYRGHPKLNSVLPLAVLISNENGKWNEAKSYLKQFVIHKKLNVNVDSLYKTIEIFKPKKASTAINLSTFMPGSGQYYANERLHGMLNAGLILSFLSWGAYNTINGFYTTALFSGFFVAYTFYQGGIGYSESAVNHYNEAFVISFKSKVRSIVLP